MRVLTTLAVLAAVGGFALADIAPPAPPKGKKYVNVASEVKLGKDVKVSDYVFVLEQVTYRPAPTRTGSKVELSADKATATNPGGRRSSAFLFAVPADKVKDYKSDEELQKALQQGKVKGAVNLSFPGTATVSDTVKGDTVTWTYTVTGIDEKGIKTEVSGDGTEKKEEKKEEKKKLAFAEPGYLIGGVALTVGVTLGGLWLVRRRK
jgi:hypothetical protein